MKSHKIVRNKGIAEKIQKITPFEVIIIVRSSSIFILHIFYISADETQV